MRELLNYPLGVLGKVFKTFAGWTAVMAISWIVGLLVGLRGGLFNPFDIPSMLVVLVFLAFVRLEIFFAFLFMAGGWTLGLFFESLRFRIIVAAVNGILWVAIGVWLKGLSW